METGAKQIARRYVKSYRFLIDMSGAFPYGVVGVFVPTWYYIKLFEFFKLAFVVRITSTIANDGTGSTKNMCVLCWLPLGLVGGRALCGPLRLYLCEADSGVASSGRWPVTTTWLTWPVGLPVCGVGLCRRPAAGR